MIYNRIIQRIIASKLVYSPLIYSNKAHRELPAPGGASDLVSWEPGGPVSAALPCGPNQIQ